MFVPTVFTTTRQKMIDSFYQQNECIEYKMLQELEIDKPQQFMKKHFGSDSSCGGVSLETCFVSSAVITRVDVEISECVLSESILNLAPILPFSFSPNDITALVNACPSFNKEAAAVAAEALAKEGKSADADVEGGSSSKRSCVLVADVFVVSGSFLDAVTKRFTDAYMDQIVLSRTGPAAASASGGQADEEGTRKGKAEAQSHSAAAGAKDKKKQRGKGKGKGRGRDDQDSDDDQPAAPVQKKAAADKKKSTGATAAPVDKKFSLSLVETRKRLAEWYPDFNEDVVAPLARLLQPELVRHFVRISDSLGSGTQTLSRKRHPQLQKDFETAYFNFQVRDSLLAV